MTGDRIAASRIHVLMTEWDALQAQVRSSSRRLESEGLIRSPLTLDGHTIGDFGDAMACALFDMEAAEGRSLPSLDAIRADGTGVEIKTTTQTSPSWAFRCPDNGDPSSVVLLAYKPERGPAPGIWVVYWAGPAGPVYRSIRGRQKVRSGGGRWRGQQSVGQSLVRDVREAGAMWDVPATPRVRADWSDAAAQP